MNAPQVIERMAPNLLKPYDRNARVHGDAQIEQLAKSISAFGFNAPILIDEDNMILAGHGRFMAAAKLGLDAVPCVRLRHLSDTEKRQYILADNKIGLNATWDAETMGAELADLFDLGVDMTLLGFSGAELRAYTAPQESRREQNVTSAMIPEDATCEVATGDVWDLGDHVLGCGDCTDEAFVQDLLDGRGDVAVAVTSPPYLGQRNYTGIVSDWLSLMNGWLSAAGFAETTQVLVNLGLVHDRGHAIRYWEPWLEAAAAQGWRHFGLYVWDQGPGLPGKWAGRLAPAFELIFHLNKKARLPNKIVIAKEAGRPLTGNGMRTADGTMSGNSHRGRATQDTKIPDSVIRIMREKDSKSRNKLHPARYPIGFAEWLIAAYSDPGEIVFDPFSGSGTTLIAAEISGRTAIALEIEPMYCALALDRWQAQTDKRAVRRSDGAYFDELLHLPDHPNK